jgi:hypothetical protein
MWSSLECSGPHVLFFKGSLRRCSCGLAAAITCTVNLLGDSVSFCRVLDPNVQRILVVLAGLHPLGPLVPCSCHIFRHLSLHAVIIERAADI